MLVRELLLESLDDLQRDDFKTFKWHLMNKVMDGYKKIAKARLENASQTDTVDRMTENYGDEMAVSVSVDILGKMGMRSIAEDLKKKYAAAGRNTATPSTTSPAVAPPAAPAPSAAPVTMAAQEGSVIVTPTLVGGTTGTLNITINK